MHGFGSVTPWLAHEVGFRRHGAEDTILRRTGHILKPPLVVDKSWVVGASKKDIEVAIRRFHLLLPEILLYELLTTVESQKRQNLRKISLLSDRTYSGLGTLGALLRYEAKHKKPCGRLVRHSKDVSDVYIKLADPDYRLIAHEYSALSEKEVNREKEAASAFMVASQALCRLHPQLMRLRGVADPTMLGEISRLIKDETLLAALYAEVRSSFYSAPEKVDSKWALFRRTQAHLMMAVVYVRSYGDTPLDRMYKKVANLYLDTEYLVFGALAGALATGDILLQNLFTIMCPDAELVTLITRSETRGGAHNSVDAPDANRALRGRRR